MNRILNHKMIPSKNPNWSSLGLKVDAKSLKNPFSRPAEPKANTTTCYILWGQKGETRETPAKETTNTAPTSIEHANEHEHTRKQNERKKNNACKGKDKEGGNNKTQKKSHTDFGKMGKKKKNKG